MCYVHGPCFVVGVKILSAIYFISKTSEEFQSITCNKCLKTFSSSHQVNLNFTYDIYNTYVWLKTLNLFTFCT